ncbi:hypothetical protein HPHPH30_1014 [Helicobacter pylori Hp H-30]|nr:hypothetical protein HPHPH30_1014 [Helicobacter pylori Hp H-30]
MLKTPSHKTAIQNRFSVYFRGLVFKIRILNFFITLFLALLY